MKRKNSFGPFKNICRFTLKSHLYSRMYLSNSNRFLERSACSANTEDELLDVNTSSLTIEDDGSSVCPISTETKLVNSKTRKVSRGVRCSRWAPCYKCVKDLVLRLPPKYRRFLLYAWFGWKIGHIVVLLYLFLRGLVELGTKQARTRILYIVTSSVAYNNDIDRLTESVLPVLSDMFSQHVDDRHVIIDVYFILAYKVRQRRADLLRKRLPTTADMEFWEEACPLSYIEQDEYAKLEENCESLSQQQRCVIKDKLLHYNYFVVIEDDPINNVTQVQHNLDYAGALSLGYTDSITLSSIVMQTTQKGDPIIASNISIDAPFRQ